MIRPSAESLAAGSNPWVTVETYASARGFLEAGDCGRPECLVLSVCPRRLAGTGCVLSFYLAGVDSREPPSTRPGWSTRLPVRRAPDGSAHPGARPRGGAGGAEEGGPGWLGSSPRRRSRGQQRLPRRKASIEVRQTQPGTIQADNPLLLTARLDTAGGIGGHRISAAPRHGPAG
jgi:hypothetical protein